MASGYEKCGIGLWDEDDSKDTLLHPIWWMLLVEHCMGNLNPSSGNTEKGYQIKLENLQCKKPNIHKSSLQNKQQYILLEKLKYQH